MAVLQRVKAATTTQATTLTATLPNPTTVGATQIALITVTSGSSGITMPGGWTQRATNTSQLANCFIYDHAVTATNQQSLTLTLPSGGAVIYLIEVSGLNGFDVSGTASAAGPTSSIVTGSVTPTTTSSYLLAFAAHDTNTTDSFGAPVVLVDQQTLTGASTSFHSAYAEGTTVSTSATTATITSAVAASGWETLFVAYKSSSSGSVALSGSGTLSFSGTPATSGSGSLSGSGTLSFSGKPATSGSVALSGSGALTLSGALGSALAFTGSGSLTFTAGPLAVSGAVALSSSGSLTFSTPPPRLIFRTPYVQRRMPISPPLSALINFSVAVLRIGGQWVETEYPTEEQINAADLYFPGGHENPVDPATAAILTAAGYQVNTEPL